MRSPRFYKIVRDLWQNKERSLLVILAIAIGIFGVGSILTSTVIQTREMKRNYLDTNPASVVFYGDSFDKELAAEVAGWPGVETVEPRSRVTGRYEMAPNQWITLHLFVIDDFANLRINTFYPEEGEWPPAPDEILLERSALDLFDSEVGQPAVIKTPNGVPQTLTIAGSVHDPGQAPAWMEGFGYGYITPAGLERLGEAPVFTELRIVASENTDDREGMRRLADRWQARLADQRVSVVRTEVPVPDEHPHQGQMQTLLFLLETFGILAMLMSGVLVATLISALIGQQIRQIGVMKAFGARRRQVFGVYLGMVVILGLLALLVGMPLATWGGRAYADFAAMMLNFEISSYKVGLWVYLVQAGAALLIPAVAAALPVYKGSRITVREAISDNGVDEGAFGTRVVDNLLGQLRTSKRLLLMAIRNPFRKQGRLLLTVLALAAGGAVFITALSVGASWQNTTDLEFTNRRYDMLVTLKEVQPISEVVPLIRSIPAVLAAEGWLQVQTAVNYPDGTQGQSFNLLAPSAGTEMIDLVVLEGRWLEPSDTNAVVVSHMLAADEPSIAVGRSFSFDLNGEETSWEVVGIARMIGPGVVFANADAVESNVNLRGMTNYLVIDADTVGSTGETTVLQNVESALANAEIPLIGSQTSASARKSLDDHLVIIVVLLMIMATLVAAVGGLGLMSTMNLNVLERQREIGVMRAVGATSRKVLTIILGEGIVIGLMSWVWAVLLSIPLTNLVARISGQIFIETPLSVVYSWSGMGIWLGVVVVITTVACSIPALAATDLPVNTVLSYE